MRGCPRTADGWVNGFLDEWIGGAARVFNNPTILILFMEYTKRRNLNRGYMKLEAWQRGMELFALAFRLATVVSDFKLRSQFRDAAQSVSANIAEGYGRRSLPEYLQFLYYAKGSLAETLTRAMGLQTVKIISDADFESLDQLHYEVENKLLRLIESLEKKRGTNEWHDTLPPSNPPIQKSIHPLPA
jgi:four helix bundle protein